MNKKSDNELMRKLYSTGSYTHAQVAEILGVTYGRVSCYYQTHKLKYGFPKRQCVRQSILMKNVKKAYHLYKQGKTLEQIGQLYGNVSRERVRQVFKKHGMKCRSAGMSKKNKICLKGHKLGKGEYFSSCPKCREIRKAWRARGGHLKKHCIWGHPMKGRNILAISLPNGKKGRRCRTCFNKIMRQQVAKKRS